MKALKRLVIFTALGSIGWLVGCGGGTGFQTIGSQCPADPFQPIPTTAQASEKQYPLSSPPPGTYTYNGASLYYVGPTNNGDSTNSLRVQMGDVKQADGAFDHPNLSCVRNASAGFSKLAISVTGIESFTIDSKGVFTGVKTRDLILGTDNSLHMVPSYKEGDTNPESLKAAYKDVSTDPVLVLLDANNNYDMRSTGKTSDGGIYTLVVHLVLTPAVP